MDYTEEIFLNARNISDPNDQASYIWDACCGDTSFLKQVRSMLAEVPPGPSPRGSNSEFSGHPLLNQ